MTSRVHQLARMSTLELIGLYTRMLRAGQPEGSLQTAQTAISGGGGHPEEAWDRDQLVTAIRNLEDPR